MMSNNNGEMRRIFVTGATGYIGRSVVEKAVARGYDVRGLSRNEEGDAKVKALGATPVRGDLTTLDVLSKESAQADAVLQLAFAHKSGAGYNEVLRIDAAAVDAICVPLRGTGKAFVMASGTAVVAPEPAGNETTEESPLSETFALKDRVLSERNALRMSHEGVRVCVIRLPPYVYGRGGSNSVPWLLETAAKNGESLYEGDGSLRTSDVDVDDAAELFLLAAEAAKPGDIFNGTRSTKVTLRELAEAVGAALELPVRSVSRKEMEEKWGEFRTKVFLFQNRASNRKAVEQLGWQPQAVDVLTDIRSGSYRELAAKLKTST